MATSSKTSVNRLKFWVILLSVFLTFGILIVKIREYYLSQKLKETIPKPKQEPKPDPKPDEKKNEFNETLNESLMEVSSAN